MTTKLYQCGRCKEHKARTAFFADNRDKRGIRTYECKACYAARRNKGPTPTVEPLPASAVRLLMDWIFGRKAKGRNK